jgi:hypothetical protein
VREVKRRPPLKSPKAPGPKPGAESLPPLPGEPATGGPCSFPPSSEGEKLQPQTLLGLPIREAAPGELPELGEVVFGSLDLYDRRP